MISILAIDPGRCTGFCLLGHLAESGGWRILTAGVTTPDDGLDFDWKSFDFLVIENPVIYPRSPVPPNDILTLARVVGRFEERFQRRAKFKQLVAPREWKGSVEKSIMAARIERALSPEDVKTLKGLGVWEMAKSYRHNMLDAIGLAYWATRQPWARAQTKSVA